MGRSLSPFRLNKNVFSTSLIFQTFLFFNKFDGPLKRPNATVGFHFTKVSAVKTLNSKGRVQKKHFLLQPAARHSALIQKDFLHQKNNSKRPWIIVRIYVAQNYQLKWLTKVSIQYGNYRTETCSFTRKHSTHECLMKLNNFFQVHYCYL